MDLNATAFFLIDACDPTWRSTRDGLFISGFVASILSFILAALVVWIHVYYNYSSSWETSYSFVLIGHTWSNSDWSCMKRQLAI